MSNVPVTIESLTAHAVAYPEPHYRGVERYLTFARVEANDGTVGWGEAISQFPESALATKTIVETGFAPLLIGRDPRAVPPLWEALLERVWWYGQEGIAAFAISAVDMALWDLAGRLAGEPVATLLGGDTDRSALAMGSIIFDMEDTDWTLNQFAFMRDAGYRVVKAGWGMRPEALFGQDRHRDVEMVRRLREEVIGDLDLVVDTPGHLGLWDVETAIERCQALAPYGLRWLEQPLPPADLSGHAALRGQSPVQIGTGEDEWNVESYARLVGSGGVDVVQIDPGRALGISGAREVVQLVYAAGLEPSFHTWSSALNTAASIHLATLGPQPVCMDFKPHRSPMQHELVTEPWVPSDGYLSVRETPGLGVEVNEAVVAHYELD